VWRAAWRAGTLARMRRAREIWVQIVGQYEQSGLTQEAYAAQRGIPVATLRSWIYKLRHESDGAVPVLPVRVVALRLRRRRRAS
jgi:DNA-binding transcriptional regulator YiaG